MRRRQLSAFLLLVGCAGSAAPDAAPGPDLWSGSYRYGGTRTKLAREGKYYRFSDARLRRYYFRAETGGWLEDDTTRDPVRVYPDIASANAKPPRPYRTLRIVWRDEDLFLERRTTD